MRVRKKYFFVNVSIYLIINHIYIEHKQQKLLRIRRLFNQFAYSTHKSTRAFTKKRVKNVPYKTNSVNWPDTVNQNGECHVSVTHVVNPIAISVPHLITPLDYDYWHNVF